MTATETVTPAVLAAQVEQLADALRVALIPATPTPDSGLSAVVSHLAESLASHTGAANVIVGICGKANSGWAEVQDAAIDAAEQTLAAVKAFQVLAEALTHAESTQPAAA